MSSGHLPVSGSGGSGKSVSALYEESPKEFCEVSCAELQGSNGLDS